MGHIWVIVWVTGSESMDQRINQLVNTFDPVSTQLVTVSAWFNYIARQFVCDESQILCG